MSFTSTLMSSAPLPQSHKRIGTIGGKDNVNPNSNVSNSVVASSSRDKVRGRSSRNRGRSSRGRGNQNSSKAVDVYLWRRIYNLVKTYVTEHPYFKTSRPTRSINENFQRLEFFYETFPRKIFQQIAAETNYYYAQSQQNISNKYTQYVAFTEAKLLAFFGVKSAID